VQRVRHALAVRLAVGGENIVSIMTELERGPDLADEMRDLVAGVPELVRGTRRHGEALAGATSFSRPTLKPTVPRRTSKRSSWLGWTCAAARAVRLDVVSITTAAPFVPRLVCRRQALAGDRVLDESLRGSCLPPSRLAAGAAVVFSLEGRLKIHLV
jgi:hypothetical protein